MNVKSSGGAAWLRGRVVLSVFVAAMVTGCVTASGPTYLSVAHKGLEPGRARVVAYSDESAGGEIKIDGLSFGTIANRSFIFRDVPAGLHQITGEQAGYPGVTRRELSAAPGHTYYFAIRMSQRAKTLSTAVTFAGLAGYAVAAAATSDDGGPVDIIPVDEATARQAISEFKMADQ
jgi:hypothetical protein